MEGAVVVDCFSGSASVFGSFDDSWLGVTTAEAEAEEMLLLEEDVGKLFSADSDSGSLLSTSSMMEPESVVTLEGLC